MTFRDELELLGACPDAIKWVGDRTFEEAWRDCRFGPWMIWLVMRMAGKSGWSTYQDVVSLLYDMASQMLHRISQPAYRPAYALAVVRLWCAGKASTAELRNADMVICGDYWEARYADSVPHSETNALYGISRVVEAALSTSGHVDDWGAVMEKLSKKEDLILNMLSDSGSELYGLDMVERSDGALGRGTIYVTLSRMKRRGYVTDRVETGIPMPDRRLYKITNRGRAALLTSTGLRTLDRLQALLAAQSCS